MFFDRDHAKLNFYDIIKNPQKEWIAIVGNTGIGKSSFIKEVLGVKENVYICEPIYELKYWREFSNIIKKYSKEILSDFFKTYSNYKQQYLKDDFIETLNQERLEQIIEEIIKSEINSETIVFAKFTGRFLCQKIKYIVLDNFYQCSLNTYEWLVAFTNCFSTNTNSVIVICDMDKNWESNRIKEIFQERYCEISIEQFDDQKAYYDLLKSSIYFNNERKLIDLSSQLYNEFHGNARIILKLIEEIGKADNLYDDEIKKKFILEKSSNLVTSCLINLNSMECQILSLLAISPIPLSKNNIAFVFEHSIEHIKNEIDILSNKNLITFSCDVYTSENLYKTSDSFSKNVYTNLVDEKYITYLNLKLFSLFRNNKIQMKPEQIISIIVECDPTGGNEYIYDFLTSNEQYISREYKAFLLKYLIDNNFINLRNLVSIDNLTLMFDFGYYESAKTFVNYFDKIEEDYILLMKLGDLSHLTLDKKTSAIFKKASELSNISTSEYLSAINRQIMAMTQQDKQGLLNAKQLYESTINKFSDKICKGLIELYRNANNIFEYPQSLNLTIRGYELAGQLGEKLEQIKCLHNICMIELLNGNYEMQYNPPGLNFKPSFDCIYNELSKFENFRHEMAYPLLDMAAVKMFQFSKHEKKVYLTQAKSFYSEAQLYARSFYAKNIAEMGLLVVNSYLYPQDKELKKWRRNLFVKYTEQMELIKDFRVHRKILFSLATSSLITTDNAEGINYLMLSKKHVFGKETLRYNRLCDAFNISEEQIAINQIGKVTDYHKTIKFVPWLISFGH